jgi:hypothetical protein
VRKSLLIGVACLVSVAAYAQGVRQICDPRNVCFYCQRGNPTCEASYALSRVFTPPGATPNMRQILPPSLAPSPGPLYGERYGAAVPPPPPPPAPREMSRDEERENVIRQGEAFCAKYPGDRVCHPLPPDAPPH